MDAKSLKILFGLIRDGAMRVAPGGRRVVPNVTRRRRRVRR